MRLLMGFSIVLLLAAGLIAAPSDRIPIMAIVGPEDRPADKIVMPDDPLPDAEFMQPLHRWQPRRDDIIGEVFEAGDTYYDYQSNGAIGKFIGVDQDGSIHVTWMDGYTEIEENERHQAYNVLWADSLVWEWDGGAPVDDADRSGYGCMWLTEEEEQRALVFTHVMGGPFPNEMVWAVALDFFPGWGAFSITVLPSFPDALLRWPQGVMSPGNDIIHIVGNNLTGDNEGGRIGYVPSFIGGDEVDFDVEIPSGVGTTNINSYRIARSRVSNRAAITWITTRTEIPARPNEWEGLLAFQMNNDLMLAYSDENGENWNFDNPINVTDCIMPDIRREEGTMYGDTLLPYCSHDIIFDEGDNIHIVFEVRGLWWDPTWEEGDEPPPLRDVEDWWLRPGLTVDASYLYHWSEETEEFSVVADGWYLNWIWGEDEDGNDVIVLHPTPGAWRSNVCYPSLAYDDENGDLYCVYNYYPPDDYNDYVNRDGRGFGRCNGDVAVTVSEDNGATWLEPTMVVETRTHLSR